MDALIWHCFSGESRHGQKTRMIREKSKETVEFSLVNHHRDFSKLLWYNLLQSFWHSKPLWTVMLDVGLLSEQNCICIHQHSKSPIAERNLHGIYSVGAPISQFWAISQNCPCLLLQQSRANMNKTQSHHVFAFGWCCKRAHQPQWLLALPRKCWTDFLTWQEQMP